MKRVVMTVTYITDADLFMDSRKKEVEEITGKDVVDFNAAVKHEEIVIFKREEKYKVIKSRY